MNHIENVMDAEKTREQTIEGKIKEKSTIPKYYKTCISNEILKDFEKSNEKTRKKIIGKVFKESENNYLESKDDVYSLLLNRAIAHKNKTLVNAILKLMPAGKKLLTAIDHSDISPIVNTLRVGIKEIMNDVKTYIENNRIIKVEADKNDLVFLKNILMYPNFEHISIKECFNDYIKPVFVESCLGEIQDIVNQIGDLY